ncbi:MAG: gamma-butyrobetaine hydroxylase-like domain-containing protein [Prosthecobacter sp.]|nr:gamma-butyrobetaine hydroxylase-like domain-containing protein [Prosthecobacter sp.]
MNAPKRLEVIGNELAILWEDGSEDYIPTEKLRAWSPSAETTGERDLMGRKIGGSDQKTYPGVTVRNWRIIGGYAVQFDFSDGHNTGLYGFEYLKKLGREAAAPQE